MGYQKNTCTSLFSKISQLPYFTMDPREICYFLGFSPSYMACLIISPQKYIFYTDARYIEVLEDSVTKEHAQLLHKDEVQSLSFLKNSLIKNGLTKLSINPQLYKYFDVANMQKICLEIKVELVFDYKSINQIMNYKTSYEIQYIKKAQEITEKSIAGIIGLLKTNVSELDIALELEYLMKKQGAQSSAFDSIVLFGENTSRPHGVPSNRKLKYGDIILLDSGARYNNYCSDMTRMFVFGEPSSDDFLENYEILLKIQTKILENIKVNFSFADLSLLAVNELKKYDLAEYFTHSLGHGIGIHIHETPFMSLENKEVIEKRQVFTIEPGIYFKKRYGIRIEDLVYINEYGKVEIISGLTKNLIQIEAK